jgi:hypothetical protein
MQTYLSLTPVFLTPTREIRALDEKSILITVPSGSATPAKIRVAGADPQGRDASKCSVAVWQASVDHVEWADVGSGQPIPAGQSHEWRRFVTVDAVNLIRPNEDDPTYDLSLELPTEET